jgi:hypothetical protein
MNTHEQFDTTRNACAVGACATAGGGRHPCQPESRASCSVSSKSPYVYAGEIGSTSLRFAPCRRPPDERPLASKRASTETAHQPRGQRLVPYEYKKGQCFETGHQSVGFLVISREQVWDESTIGSRPSGTDLSCVGGRAVKRPRCVDSCQVRKFFVRAKQRGKRSK